jgi:hypothetical protein
LQPTADEEGVHPLTQPAPGHNVVNDIFHFDAAFDCRETMLMKPEAEGSEALFIDKPVKMLDMLDFGYPRHGDPCHRSDTVSDDQARPK